MDERVKSIAHAVYTDCLTTTLGLSAVGNDGEGGEHCQYHLAC